MLNERNGFLDLLVAHGTLAKRQAHGAAHLVAVVLAAHAGALDDGRHIDFHALKRRETLAAMAALTATSNGEPIFARARVHHRCVLRLAKRATHLENSWKTPGNGLGSINGEHRRELIDFGTHTFEHLSVLGSREQIGNEVGHLARFFFLKAAGGHGRRAQTNA